MHTIANNIYREFDKYRGKERMHTEAALQCVGYMDETPYGETYYFRDKSELEFDYSNNTITAR